MKFDYGKQDFKTLERGQENCWLLTNGLGGFSSATAVGSASRNDHALLMACVKAPNLRYNMIHRLSEQLMECGGKSLPQRERSAAASNHAYWVSSQEFAGGRSSEDGWTHLSRFTFEDCPTWVYHMAGVEIVKEIAMKQGENTVVVRYKIDNRSRIGYIFSVTPFMQFTKKGEDLLKDQTFTLEEDSVASNGLRLFLTTNGNVTRIPLVHETYHYAYDECDGRREQGTAAANHRITRSIPAGQTAGLEIMYSMEPQGGNRYFAESETEPTAEKDRAAEMAAAVIRESIEYRNELAAATGFRDPVAAVLSRSAAQFIAKRESTGGDTILAGYPFFEDWGRDTMIALPGCCLAVKQFATAKSILRTFLKAERNGLLPNLFPEGGNAPMYNTVDASLLFINAVYLYYRHTGDLAFVKECYPVMENIIRCYREGTDFAIHMDSDGLIMAGQGYDQVTWMDVRVGEILPTPRHGKPVEVNAYWYNSLRVMELFEKLTDQKDQAGGYGSLADLVKKSFCEKFWLESRHCLKDVVSEMGTVDGMRSKTERPWADTQIRCNQIWAVSMPFSMLDPEQEKQVVETVYEKLYTPYGLRTLAPEDDEFKPYYGGSQIKRDLAYHQGTVWVFPLGGYYLAYLKVHKFDSEAKMVVRRQLDCLAGALREGCAGQLPEIYDGENPTSSRGCFAQAWSVGEILRVYEALEQEQSAEKER